MINAPASSARGGLPLRFQNKRVKQRYEDNLSAKQIAYTFFGVLFFENGVQGSLGIIRFPFL